MHSLNNLNIFMFQWCSASEEFCGVFWFEASWAWRVLRAARHVSAQRRHVVARLWSAQPKNHRPHHKPTQTQRHKTLVTTYEHCFTLRNSVSQAIACSKTTITGIFFFGSLQLLHVMLHNTVIFNMYSCSFQIIMFLLWCDKYLNYFFCHLNHIRFYSCQIEIHI